MEAILNFLRQEDAAVVVLAVLINLLTGLIKLPLKKLAARRKSPPAIRGISHFCR